MSECLFATDTALKNERGVTSIKQFIKTGGMAPTRLADDEITITFITPNYKINILLIVSVKLY